MRELPECQKCGEPTEWLNKGMCDSCYSEYQGRVSCGVIVVAGLLVVAGLVAWVMW